MKTASRASVTLTVISARRKHYLCRKMYCKPSDLTNRKHFFKTYSLITYSWNSVKQLSPRNQIQHCCSDKDMCKLTPRRQILW